MSLLIATLLAAAQEPVQAPVETPAPTEVKAAAEPEKICKRKIRATGESGVHGVKSVKVCKTKEAWDKMKSGER